MRCVDMLTVLRQKHQSNKQKLASHGSMQSNCARGGNFRGTQPFLGFGGLPVGFCARQPSRSVLVVVGWLCVCVCVCCDVMWYDVM